MASRNGNPRANQGNSSYREDTLTVNDFTNPVGSLPYTVEGEGGKARHKGEFYTNNPYLNELMWANNNEDKDALYERAVEWDADYYNLTEQRAYNQAVLEEQREYDSPVNQIARQRAAGINPELASGSNGSGSGSGSSAQMGQASIADQQGQTKFSNKYDNINNVFNGINAASNMVNSLFNGVSSITNAISLLGTLDSRIALNEANANLANAQAHEVNALLEGRKKSIDISNIQGFMDITSRMNSMLSEEFTDEEGLALGKSLGIDEESIPGFLGGVREIRKRPEVLSEFEKNKVELRKQKAASKIYTQKACDDMANLYYKVEETQLQLSYASDSLHKSIATALLNDPNYATNVVEGMTQGAELNNVNTSLALQKARYDANQWAQLLTHKMDYVKAADDHVHSIIKKAQEDGVWTEEEYYAYNTAYASYIALRDITSNEFNSMKQYMMKIFKTRYDMMSLLDENGSVRNIDFVAAYENFSRVMFDDIYTGKASAGEVVRGWVDTAGDLLVEGAKAGAMAYGAGQYGNSVNVSKTAGSTQEFLYDNNKNKWIPQKLIRTHSGVKYNK